MKCLVVSDSHGRSDLVNKLIDQYREEADVMIHCGDIEDYAENFPEMMIVSGNNDIFYDLPDSLIVPFGKHRILVAHGHQFAYMRRVEKLAEAARKNACDIVCFGHTHVADVQTIHGVLVVNPGSLWRSRDGRGPSYALIEDNGESLKAKHIFL